MPEEVFLLSLFGIAAGTFLVTFLLIQIFAYAKARTRASESAGSVTTSDLEQMMRRIVRSEVASVLGKESGYDDRLLEEHREDEFDFDSEEAREVKRRPTVRRGE